MNESPKEPTQTDRAISRIQLLSAQVEAVRETIELKLDPVLRAALPQPPVPGAVEVATYDTDLPPLFANLHEQMNMLQQQVIRRLAGLIDRIEL